jgi:hypothetical protein
MFRGLLHLPGTVCRSGADRIEVVLDRPSSEKVAIALQKLMTELNSQPFRMLATGPILAFRLADVNIPESLT